MRFNGYIWKGDGKTEILQGIEADAKEKAIEFVREVCDSRLGVGFMVNQVHWRFFENSVHIEFQGKNITNMIQSKKDLDEFLASRKTVVGDPVS